MQTFRSSSTVSLAGASAPIRVLFLHPSDELYGSDVVLLNLITRLNRNQFEPYVMLANDLPYKGLLSTELRRHGIPTVQFPIAVARRKYLTAAGLPWFVARQHSARRLVARFIEEHHIDVVYTNTLAVWTGAQAAWATNRPHVWHVHEIIQRPAVLRRHMQRFVPSRSQQVICVSQATQDGLLRGPTARAKGVILHNGLDPKPFMTAPGRARVRKELVCHDDEVLIGFVGRISDFKAPDVFVRAALQVLALRPNVRFFLAGDSVPGQPEMWNRVSEMIAASEARDRILLLGYRHDVADLDAALDILVVSSRGLETCSLVSVQAMFAAKPVIATDVGAMRETVTDGETGLIVPPEDWQAIARAIIGLVDDPARRIALGCNGQTKALKLFTLERQIAQFHRLLEAVAGSVEMVSHMPAGRRNA